MRIGGVVQARMGSRRLPGKVLAAIAGQPLLQLLLERLERSEELATVVVATSTAPADDAVADLCARHGVACHRGSEDDVAGRMRDAASAYDLDAMARISGDSPLLDPAVVDRVGRALREHDVDVATNVFPRTFPPGQSVEVVRVDAFARACAAMTDAGDREHVTTYLYRHPELFSILNVEAPRDYGGLALAVDTAEDMERIAAIVARMNRPVSTYGLDEIVELSSRC